MFEAVEEVKVLSAVLGHRLTKFSGSRGLREINQIGQALALKGEE